MNRSPAEIKALLEIINRINPCIPPNEIHRIADEENILDSLNKEVEKEDHLCLTRLTSMQADSYISISRSYKSGD